MFLDVCVKREIMDLKAHCPHPGCQEILELRHIEVHQAKCQFLPIPCPNMCGCLCNLAEIENHLAVSCEKRQVPCQFCQCMVQLDRMQHHHKGCPKVSVKCPHCEEMIIQEMLQSHIDMQCSKVEVPCAFTTVGCKEKMKRELLEKHLEKCIHQHMALLTNSLIRFQFSVSQLITNQHRSMVEGPSLDFAPDYRGHMNVTGEMFPPGLRPHYVQDPMASESSPVLRPSFVHDPSNLQRPRLSEDSHTSGVSSISSSMESLQVQQSEYSQQPRRYQAWPISRGGKTEHWQSKQDGRNSPEVLVLKDRLKYQEQKTAVQEQKIFELHTKVRSGDQKLAEKDETIDSLRDQLRNIEARNCAGKFYWKLEQFSSLCEEANLKGSDSVVRHSQGFYTSFHGYKLCVRVNINFKDPNKGYVALFIHFMKGEFDDYLEWPFEGNITLSIEDQNIDYIKRKHISETLIAKPGLAAFDKPASNRNHKGFGYMEFAPLASIDNGTYVKDGAIVIKVIVCPTSDK
ncbi:TNF receptor-associated factor 6-like isoform X2 [Antedon mediterranea]